MVRGLLQTFSFYNNKDNYVNLLLRKLQIKLGFGIVVMLVKINQLLKSYVQNLLMLMISKNLKNNLNKTCKIINLRQKHSKRLWTFYQLTKETYKKVNIGKNFSNLIDLNKASSGMLVLMISKFIWNNTL